MIPFAETSKPFSTDNSSSPTRAVFPNLPTNQPNRKLLACLISVEDQIVPFATPLHSHLPGRGPPRRGFSFSKFGVTVSQLVEISSKKKVTEGDVCLTNGNNLCLGTSAKKLVALPTATWEAMSEVINTGKDGNSLLRPGCNPPNCFFPNAIPLGEMIEKNAPHPSLKRGIRADFRRIVASWSSRRIPIGCPSPGSLLREIKLAQIRECASFTRLFFFYGQIRMKFDRADPPSLSWLGGKATIQVREVVLPSRSRLRIRLPSE